MFDVTTFLIRWLFLSNLARDVAEIQTLPCQPYYPPHHPHEHPFSSSSESAPPPNIPRHKAEEHWRDDCIRGILSYPPGQQRLFVMDAIRVELVQQLSRNLQKSSDAMKRAALAAAAALHRSKHATTINSFDSATGETISDPDDDNDDDPFLDADVEILETFGQPPTTAAATDAARLGHGENKRATLVLSRDETNVVESVDGGDTKTSTGTSTHAVASSIVSQRIPNDSEADTSPPSVEEVQEASRTLREVKDYLPQLVAAVLRSPPAFDPHLSNPVQKLRQLLLRRCAQDPGFGIDLCWLLEAEVGRAWKTLFEHRQQTGRRLIVVLPAEKAAVLAKIGNEKRGAFDLLQDAEQATAYGYTFDSEKLQPTTESDESDDCGVAPRLPSSLSLRRCSHFGDTMHFVDRLTKVSMELRTIPPVQRLDVLHESLHEMNRRIRRRMVSRGDISLDVEDFRGPFDWPNVEDLTLDMIHSSVHFPLVPQKGVWPNGQSHSSSDPLSLSPGVEVVRVLNIVVPEARILASRERCPFLVHMEVADTNLEASDARLYASGVQNLGSTLEEALGMSAAAGSAAASRRHSSMPPSYEIPEELLHNHRTHLVKRNNEAESSDAFPERLPPRGGWQADEMFAGDGYMYQNPYETVRQGEYEALHLQMHSQQQQGFHNPPAFVYSQRPSVSTGTELLNNVFGLPWESKCQEIREASPFGHVKGWRLASFIMKAGEDIRREALVMQVISKLRTWFQEIPEEHRPVLRPYTIMTVGGDAGMIECLSDAKSVDEVKKRTDSFVSLREYFERAYGPPGTSTLRGAMNSRFPLSFEKAQDNFLRSLVGYSLICYILQVKDRHSGNILLDREGHIMHIDFGFVLGDTPKMGKVPIFSERAPFKLSSEFWEVLGGWNIHSGGLGVRFCKMFELAFACASSHADEIATLVEGIMEMLTSNANSARVISNGVRSRLRMRGPHGSVQQKSFIVDIVNAALTCWGTSTYDWLQRSMNGYQ